MSDPVLDPEDVAVAGPVRLIDAREPWQADADPVPGAVLAPVADWIAAAKDPARGLADQGFWAREIGALGAGPGVTAVAFDDGRMTEAARVWFLLQHFGAEARIVNCGGPALVGHALAVAPPARGFVARPGGGVGLMDRDAVQAALGRAQVLDARSVAEHRREDLRANARGGRLPGATLLPHAALLEDGRLRPAADLRSLLERAGFRDGAPIISHCDGGGRAALAAAAAVRAGFGDVRAYYLSFADWAADESCPVERP